MDWFWATLFRCGFESICCAMMATADDDESRSDELEEMLYIGVFSAKEFSANFMATKSAFLLESNFINNFFRSTLSKNVILFGESI
jgi:hypothetical protein